VHTHPEALKECQELMKSVGFRDLMDNVAKKKQEEAEQEKEEVKEK
jgi:hypothetical protein